MRAKRTIVFLSAGLFFAISVREARAWRGGGGGFRGGGYGGASSFHAGGFGGGYGSVHYAGGSHYGPATGFTHVGGATYSGAGGTARYGSATHVGAGGAERYGGASYAGYGGYAQRSVNYGSIQHYDANARIASRYGANVYHGPAGGTAATYQGQYVSGAAVKGPAGYGAAAVRGPAGGTAAGYRGPYSPGAVAQLPSGYTATTWRGATYYHSGYSFYQPTYYAGALSYFPVYPPVGYFFASLPVGAAPVVYGNNTYYVADGVYYLPSAPGAQQGYVVAEAPPQAASPPQAPQAGTGGPDPLALLKRMSDYVGSQNRIRMTVDETFDKVAESGQKIQLANQRTILLKRPDKIAVDVIDSGISRKITFDGATFTVLDRLKNVYASIPLAGSLDSAMDTLAKQYGMAQPVEDLLYSDIYGRLAPSIQAGQFLGREVMLGRMCGHLAFTQPGVSWQIWIEDSDQPLPRKVVITYDTTPGRPRYSLRIAAWETNAPAPDAEFEAQLPANAVSASLATITGQPAAGQ